MVCRNCHNNKVEKKAKISKPFSLIALFVAVSFVGIMYIMQINKLATMGYEIKQREKAIEELQNTNETLKIRAAQLKSMHNIEVEKERMKMEKPEEISYLEVENAVALANK